MPAFIGLIEETERERFISNYVTKINVMNTSAGLACHFILSYLVTVSYYFLLFFFIDESYTWAIDKDRRAEIVVCDIVSSFFQVFFFSCYFYSREAGVRTNVYYYYSPLCITFIQSPVPVIPLLLAQHSRLTNTRIIQVSNYLKIIWSNKLST